MLHRSVRVRPAKERTDLLSACVVEPCFNTVLVDGFIDFRD